MNRKVVLFSLAVVWAFGLKAQDDLIQKVKGHGQQDAEQKFEFTILKDHHVLPVKDQASSGTCWSYSATSFIESELRRLKRPVVDISEMFTVRQVYLDKGIKYVRMQGHLNFGQGGQLPDVLYVMKKYGVVPATVYQGLEYGEEKNKHSELESVLKAFLDAIVKNPNGRLSTAWMSAYENILSAYLGKYPSEFMWEGRRYTPRSFVSDYLKLNPDDYIQITSFTHAPFYKAMYVEVPDNWAWGESYNLPLDDMMRALRHAIDNGFTVGWATDVSEKGFSIKNGIAIIPEKPYEQMTDEERKTMFDGPKKERIVTQEERQQAFENFETTDDHGMHITGMARDQKGTIYYITKNSWGEIPNAHRSGYIMASEAFVRYKTIALLLHKDALPRDIRSKLGL
ncbi:MAG: aminopeptidase C [Thermaurantimonas sp.]